MKTKALLTATLLLFATGLSTAVVGGPNASDGEYVIMDSGSSSASGTTAVGPNGTEYSATFSVTGSHYNNQTGVLNSSLENSTYSFNGSFRTRHACFEIKHSLDTEGENQYTLKIFSEEKQGSCIQPITYHRYEASFKADEPYQLTVKHGNKTVDTFTHPDYESSEQDQKEDTEKTGGPISNFFNFLKNLF